MWNFRAVREGERVIASNACSGPVPLPLGDVRGDVAGFLGTGSRGRIGDWGQAVLGRWACSAGSVLRAQGSSGEVWTFRAVREGERVIASNACSGPVPLPLGDVRGDAAGFLGTGSRGRIGDWGQATLCL